MSTDSVHIGKGVPLKPGAAGVAGRWQGIRRRYKWWQLTLFVIGVLSAVSVTSTLFFDFGHKPARVYPDSTPSGVDSQDFTTALGAIVGAPVESGGAIDILNNGDEFVPALLESVNQAKRTINFTVYIWSAGTISDQLLRALEKKQREGVAVRVLLDGLGSVKVPDEDFEPLIAAGGKVHKFRSPKLGKLTRFHRRTHRRSIVIDGEVGFTGGWPCPMCGSGTLRIPTTGAISMFRVTGPMARSLQTAFVDLWVRRLGGITAGSEALSRAGQR